MIKRVYVLPVGTTIYPVHYAPGKDNGLVWHKTNQVLTKEVSITSYTDVPNDMRGHFPYAFSYHLYLFPNPITDPHRSDSYVFGFIFMEQDLK